MIKKIHFNLHWPKIISVIFFIILLVSYARIFAISQPYQPGVTLNPACPPGEVNCTVEIGGGVFPVLNISGGQGGQILFQSAPDITTKLVNGSAGQVLTSNGITLAPSWETATEGISSQWTTNGNNIYYNTGNVGIGTNNPSAKLTINGSATPIGPEIITNGTFSGNADGWNLYDSGVYTDNNVTVTYTGVEDMADVSTQVNLESGKVYLLNFNLSNVSNDTVYAYFYNNDYYSSLLGNGKQSIVFTADYTGLDTIYFENWSWNDNSTWTIDDVSITEVIVPPALEVFDFTGNKIVSLGNIETNLIAIGQSAGFNATDVSGSIFFGDQAGFQASGAELSNFMGASAGYGATGAYQSNFIGYESGYAATGTVHSNFLGNSAGYGVIDLFGSNFLGDSAGYEATYATNSNFLGMHAGDRATNAYGSNFIGTSAGKSATNAERSNFLGDAAGFGSTNANNSNFLGYMAGGLSPNASSSNFIGYQAGRSATNATNSIFIGTEAGGITDWPTGLFGAVNASNSIFIGQQAGYADGVDNTSNGLSSILLGSFTNTGGYSNSIVLGSGASGAPISNNKADQFMLAPSVTEMQLRGIDYTLPSAQALAAGDVLTNDGSGILTWAAGGIGGSPSVIETVNTSNLFSTGLTGTGSNVTATSYSIFLGQNAGSDATGASRSNFFGISSGYGATNASSSNFMGSFAGNSAINATQSNFLGNSAGHSATNASYSNFLGNSAGSGATGASQSNFFGINAGYGATGASESNFMGSTAGSNALNATHSNFLGSSAGLSATSASNSNFFGYNSGSGAASASNSNFLGSSAGYTATGASYSNFLGFQSGSAATSASYSNFLGFQSGYGATSASSSNFLGSQTGHNAINASNSNFFGIAAGSNATNASNSNFIGYSAGSVAANASNSIFIGQLAGSNETVLNNTTDVDDFSILIGKSTRTGGFSNSIALGGSAANTAANQFMIGSVTRPIDSTIWKGTGGTQCTVTTGTGIACTSDERLKNNITDLSSDTLNKLIQIRTVNFNWKEGNTNANNIGFLAGDLENLFPEVVATDVNGYKSVYYANMTPIITEAIRELDLKIMDINNIAVPNSFRNNMLSWFTDAANQITEFVAGVVRAKDKLCIGEGDSEVCITKEELLEMKNNTVVRSTSIPDSIAAPITPDALPPALPVAPVATVEPVIPATPVATVLPVVDIAPIVLEVPVLPEVKKSDSKPAVLIDLPEASVPPVVVVTPIVL